MVRVNLVHQAHDYDKRSSRIVEMAAVPRIGDFISEDANDGSKEVKSVTWMVSEPRYDVHIIYW